jgi:hypothetical protein
MAKLRICSLLILLIVLASILPTQIDAEVASVFLADMNSRALFVGVVHEDSVSQINGIFEFLAERFPRFPMFWRKTAYASVKEVWKGSRYRQISYRASPSWACDESKAAAGIDAVVFLDKAYYGFEIAWAGNGRYPMLKDGPASYININDGRFPPELVPKIRSVSQYQNHLALDDLRVWCRAHSR